MKKNTSRKVSKQAVTVVIIAVTVVLVMGIKYLKWNQSNGAKASLSRTIGKPDAPVRITEWVDFQCPSCAAGALDLKKYLKTFDGKIYLEVKYFPLGGHLHSLEAAKYGECAARQGKFWPYYEMVFERQPQWRDLFDAQPAFEQIAKDIGLNESQLHFCVASDDVREKVLKEKDQGQALGIQSTPTYFINDQMIVCPKLMREQVDKLLGKAAGTTQAMPPASGG